MKLIYSEEEVRRFFSLILPEEWEEHECAFISLAARKKYLKEDEAADLGKRPEMLDKDIIRTRSAERYIAGLYRFSEANGYTDASGNPIPDSAKAFYGNIHLSDAAASYEILKNRIAKIDREVITHSLTGHCDISHALSSIKNIHGIWYSTIQNTYSRKLWIDMTSTSRMKGTRRMKLRKCLTQLM